jgi:CIC family chloride channel protein
LGRRGRLASLPLTTQVACGAAAAVATAYQAPFAGMFFAAEIVLGNFSFAEAPLLLISAFVGSLTGRYLLGGGPLFAVHAHLHAGAPHLLLALLFAIIIGALGPAYYHLVRSLRPAANLPLPLLWSGIFVGLLSLKSTEVWGNGDAALLDIMHAPQALWPLLAVLILRLCATTFCVGTGVVGGVFTPTLFAGSAIGLLIAHFVHVSDPLVLAIVGMGCLLAAVTHAPLMATLMTVELTGQWMLLPLILLCNAVAWGVARSISPHALYALATPEPVDDRAELPSVEHKMRPGIPLPSHAINTVEPGT